jgi:hypothetical protein
MLIFLLRFGGAVRDRAAAVALGSYKIGRAAASEILIGADLPATQAAGS